MNRDSRIYVAGHEGLVGSALVDRLRREGYSRVITRTHEELDLTHHGAVEEFFENERPEQVFLAAAVSGGISVNMSRPAEFIHTNLAIQSSVINAAYIAGVDRLIFFGSSCAYPEGTSQPISEEALMTGRLEPTSEYYAIAKIAGMKMCEAYNRQFGCCFFSVIPATLYGPKDNFDDESSHVLAALVAKFHRALTLNEGMVALWGSGAPKREFLYIDDLAEACLFLMSIDEIELRDAVDEIGYVINVGSGVDYTISELANGIKNLTGYRGKISWDDTKPDGVKRKLLDSNRIMNLGWNPKTNLDDGLYKTYSWYRSHALAKSGEAS